MYKQICVSKRQPKIRGVKRRLRALDLWTNSFSGYFPVECSHQKYWNYKLRVLDILVNQPQTTNKIQRHCVKALIEAACHLVEARPSSLFTAKVTVLITYPNMFGSEICIFFDTNCFDSFCDRHSQYESLTRLDKKLSLLAKLDLELPQVFTEIGFEFRYNDSELDGLTDYIEQWWLIREK